MEGINFISKIRGKGSTSKNKSIKKDTTKRKLTIQDRKNMIVKNNLSILEDYLLSRGINPKVVFPILNKNGDI